MPLDLTNDYKLWDGVETVTVIQAGTGKRQIVNHALQRGVTVRDAIGSDGTYQQGDVKWTLPVAECVVFKPDTGDFVQQADQTLWSIGTVELVSLKSRFRPWTKRVNLRPETAIDLKIYKPKFKKDETGAPEAIFKLWKQTTGHINELASQIEIEVGGGQHGRRRVKITHQIFIADQLDVQAGFKVVDPTGATWNVNRVTGKTSIGVAVTLDVEQARTPLVD